MFKITSGFTICKSISTFESNTIKKVGDSNSMVNKANVVKASIVAKANTRTF